MLATCYAFNSNDFQLKVESLKFKSNCIVVVRNEQELQFAKHDCGLRVMLHQAAGDAAAAAAADDYVLYPSLLAAAAKHGFAATGTPVVEFAFATVQHAVDSAELRQVLERSSNVIALCRLGSSPPTHLEACQLFAALGSLNKLVLANSPLSLSDSPLCPFAYSDSYTTPSAFLISRQLQQGKQRLAILEASTGGLVAGRLLSVPGASAFFISGAIVYTARGAKRILPASVLQASALMDRARNYANRANYVLSKHEYCERVAKLMRVEMKADVMLVESGTVGPDFRVPGVEDAFTVVGVAGPHDFYFARQIDLPKSRDREDNMRRFADFALDTLHMALAEMNNKSSL